MSPVSSSGYPRISPMTLALFEDSGWYTPNYTMASRYSYGRDWGYKQGCAFTTDKCLSSSQQPLGTPAHFCANLSSSNVPFCTLDRRYIGYCPATLTTTALADPFKVQETLVSYYLASGNTLSVLYIHIILPQHLLSELHSGVVT